MISGNRLALCFVNMSATWSDDFIHLILLITFVEIYSFHVEMSICKHFSLTYFVDFIESKSD